MSRHYILSYDISSNKLRTALAKLLLKSGCERIQKSVFLAPNFEPEQMLKLKKEVGLFLQTNHSYVSSDSIVCFPIKNTDIADMVWNGETKELRRIMEVVLYLLV
jgi:CRISPR-associated protein Cas2